VSPRRPRKELAHGRLLELWQHQAEYGTPLGCVSTTFTFDAGLYEEQCLARFVGMDTDPREDGAAYLIEREERLSEVFALLMVDRGHVPRQRSLRWHVLPVGVPGGILHAKVHLLAWSRLVRVIVGSANLTEPGYRRNYEQVGVLDFSAESDAGPPLPLDLLRDVVAFLRRVASMGSTLDVGPAARLEGFLAALQRQIRDWPDAGWPAVSPRVALLPVLPGRQNLFQQLGEAWGTPGPSDAEVISPFFDPGDRARATADALLQVMATNGQRSIAFVAPGRSLPRGVIELSVPKSLAEPRAPRLAHEFWWVNEVEMVDDDQRSRPLHAKALWLRRDARAALLVGSSNFTAAGTGLAPGHSNVEANLLYLMPDADSEFAKCAYEALPPALPADPEGEQVRFVDPTDTATPDAPSTALPTAFGLALFEPQPTGGTLLLHLDAGAPAGFRVLSDVGKELLREAAWETAGRPPVTEIPWPEDRPPSFLVVQWSDDDARPHEGYWPVNVTDPAKLPPPAELRNLSLAELLTILTSARPLHEILGRVVRGPVGRSGAHGAEPVPELDPHRKVDTRGFLLQRMRRVGRALEGLRDRLSRPVHSLDGLRWRLFGPIGPLVLAEKLVAEDKASGAFMTAEVALALADIDWRPAERALGREPVRAVLAEVLEQLHAMSRREEVPERLRGYVDRAFGRARALEGRAS